ncbi:MAG: 16S rRNA (guanine(527)-N(7))-methyltransferase RsmG [Calditrichia bacterium]
MENDQETLPPPEHLNSLLAQRFSFITPFQLSQLSRYAGMLRFYNQKINLISRMDTNHIWENHLIPSLIPLTLQQLPAAGSLLDFGSGGGLPGIPLKITNPGLQLTLLDSIRKKTLFLRKVVQNLGFENAKVQHFRLEPGQLIEADKKRYHIISVRAVETVERFYPRLQPLLAENGFILAWKGSTDIAELKNAAEVFGFTYVVNSSPEDIAAFSSKYADFRFFSIYPPPKI